MKAVNTIFWLGVGGVILLVVILVVALLLWSWCTGAEDPSMQEGLVPSGTTSQIRDAHATPRGHLHFLVQ